MPTSKRTALITGIAGQDGSYLAELLLEKGYRVVGTVRDIESATQRLPRGLAERVILLSAGDNSQAWHDLLVQEIRPHEIYNLAGLSYVPETANDPATAAEAIAMSAIRLFQAVRRFSQTTRVYQACSSEIYGSRGPHPQDEYTQLAPTSPYGAAKAYTLFAANQYRDLFRLYFATGICFNHESPRRPAHFVSRRVSLGAAKIKLGIESSLKLGALEAQRDWGHAQDYVRAMWLMLQRPEPSNYVIATGVLHTVRDMVEVAFDEVGLDWRDHVEVDPTLVRAIESRPLVGNAEKAQRELGWVAETRFEALMRMMVRHDMELLRRR